MPRDEKKQRNRTRRVRSFSLGSESYEALHQTDNASGYIDRLIEHYPPPTVTSLRELSRLVQSGHPWATQPGAARGRPRTRPLARQGLPTFGGPPPHDAAPPASWDKRRIMDWNGDIRPRESERKASDGTE